MGGTQDFSVAVEKLNALPVAEDGVCLSAVQDIVSAAKLEGYHDITSSVHGMLFAAIESKIPPVSRHIYGLCVASMYKHGRIPLSFLENFIRDHLAHNKRLGLNDSLSIGTAANTSTQNQNNKTKTKKIKTTQVTIEKKDDSAPNSLATPDSAGVSSSTVSSGSSSSSGTCSL